MLELYFFSRLNIQNHRKHNSQKKKVNPYLKAKLQRKRNRDVDADKNGMAVAFMITIDIDKWKNKDVAIMMS